MDFLLFKPVTDNTIPVIELCEDQLVGKIDNLQYATRPSTSYFVDPNKKQGIFISGRIKYKDLNYNKSLQKLFEDITEENWPLSNDYDGMFSGVAFTEDKIIVFNDPIGLWHLYYTFTNDHVAVTTNLNSMHKLTWEKLKLSSLVMEATGGEFSQYGTSTILENVYTLLPGELKVIQK